MPGLQRFAKNVWIVEGPDVRDMGFTFTTRMTLVRLSDGSIWVDSPVSVASDTLKRIAELGPVRYLIAATPRHFWRLDAWHAMFPEAQLWSSRSTLLTLKKRPLPLKGVLGDETPRAWADDLDQLVFTGNRLLDEVLFFHKQSGTVILDDLIQIHARVKGKPFRNLLFKLEGVAAPHGGVGLDIRLTFTNRNLARRSLEKLLSWDFDKLIIAHGPCVTENAKPFVERAFRWLAR
ncbi:MAG: DUF4336 domain-containing protein [Candidatus Acidiferrales bacterium]